MSLTRNDVEHVAKLARMRLSSDEIERMQSQLSAILDYMQMLDEVDTTNMPITAQVTGLVNVMRPDVARPSFPVEEALANAPDREGQFFRVKAVFDENG
ncbi:MAG: aspartyl/glutamyl-tRNA(Asn/Gln) amidotransferase subunit C [Herpetosiphonaceae bacterium]|nr:MAG: aspartyl/glutamyl-tRNA(Asn/Gln) amidotransferase subunit C [Herpetosiphonaceae bacterium]